MTNQKIAVVTTDTTGLKETAFGSLATNRAIYDILKTHYHEVTFNVVETTQELVDISSENPDLVVCCTKYIYDQRMQKKVWLSEFFDRHCVPYTGSNRAVLEYDSDKRKAKNTVRKSGIPTANFFMAVPGAYENADQLPLRLPLFVKPMDAANGNGIDENSLVHDFESFISKVDEVFTAYGVPVLVEEYLCGREFTVAVLDDVSHSSRLIAPVEIIVPLNGRGDRILGCLEKSLNNEKLEIVNEPEKTLICELVDKVFSALHARDFGRIDIKMDGNNNPFFMEANLVPGMTPETSYFPRAFNYNLGMTYEDVLLKIVELALFRTKVPPTNVFTDGNRKTAA